VLEEIVPTEPLEPISQMLGRAHQGSMFPRLARTDQSRDGRRLIDLRTLRDHWTEEGGRSVFAEIVTQCARSIYPSARAVRPDPGDEGIDTFVGELEGDLKVYQSKYFCDRIGDSQKAQIRSSWKRCSESAAFKRLVLWTLCIPIEMSIDETKWWQTWRARESKKRHCQIELWDKSDFLSFGARPDLVRIFAIALKQGTTYPNLETALNAMRSPAARPLKKLPSAAHLRDAIFVRKLEAAGVPQHRAARTAFYNFELLRASIEQGGDSDELAALEDLQERIFDLWESAFNAGSPSNLGRALVAKVDSLIKQEDVKQLLTPLPTHVIHKKGGMHYWADLCEAGWTLNFKEIVSDEDDEK
jgi:hypothetical protein